MRVRHPRTRHPKTRWKYVRRYWTAAERQILRTEWQILSKRQLLRKLPGRTWRAILVQALRMGLPFGIPQGYESLAAGAKRTNYHHATFKRIMSAHGVRMYRNYQSITGRKTKAHWIYVDPEEADEAIRRDLTLETTVAAARRLRIRRQTLTKLVQDARLRSEKAGTGSRRPPEVYDHLVSTWRSARVPQRAAGKCIPKCKQAV